MWRFAILPAASLVLTYPSQLNRQLEKTQIKNRNASGLQSAEFSRILLIKPSALGDVVHTIPVLVKLRARYPRARIDWLITPENAEVVRHHPALSNVVLFARREFSKPGRDGALRSAFLICSNKSGARNTIWWSTCMARCVGVVRARQRRASAHRV